MTASAVVQSNWRALLSRMWARDVGASKSDIVLFKIGEGGHTGGVPNTPSPSLIDVASEGVRVATGQVAAGGFTNGSAIVTGSGTNWLVDVSPGDWVKPGPDQTGISFGSAGVPGTDYDAWGQVLSVDSATQLTLSAVYAGPTTPNARPLQKASAADGPLFTFRKTLLAGDVLHLSDSPAIVEISNIVLPAEANADQLGNSPQFYEVGLFDANGVMVVYATVDNQTKIVGVQLNNIIQLVF